MRALKLSLLALAVTAVVLALAGGASGEIAAWAAAWQRDFQNDLAGALRALQGGDRGASAAILGLCFAYGVVHAIGPGHGKVLIGGYGVGRSVAIGPLSLIALAASLGQALTALALVGAGFGLLSLTRVQMTGLADGALALVSFSAIGLIGLWLAFRGLRGLWALRGPEAAEEHDHHHHHGAHCGHTHMPSAEEIARATRPRDVAALIGSISIRPCTGALFLLVIAWYIDLVWIGVLGTFAMALGTAAVTVAVAALSVTSRRAALASLVSDGRLAVLAPLLELLAGSAVMVIAAQLLLPLI
ncbi:nickel/cobalt transporter [Roseivivax sp.]